MYVCTALDCGGTARSVRDVDQYLEEVVRSLLDERHDAVGPEQPEWVGLPLLQLLVSRRESLQRDLGAGTPRKADSLQEAADLENRISGLEAARTKHHEIRQRALGRWDSSRWPMLSLEQRREAITTVLRSVLVVPLPPGRSRRAPFDPTLLRITVVT